MPLKYPFYYVDVTEVYYIDMYTGEKTAVVNSGYFFNDIWPDNKGNLCFSGITSSQDVVSGTINADGDVTIGITSNNFEVIYINLMYGDLICEIITQWIGECKWPQDNEPPCIQNRT